MKTMLTGAGGMLACDMVSYLQQIQWETHAFTEKELDILHEQSVEEKIAGIRPEALINCAAYTLVDKAESEAPLAFKINQTGTAVLARLCAKYRVKMVHISTDFIFDGQQNTPYQEAASPNPLGVYGKSKWAGEQEILQIGLDYLIVRTSWLYGVNGNNFVKTMLRLAQERPELRVVNDQTGSPTWTCDLAQAIVELLRVRAAGIVHFSNSGQCTWHQFASASIEIGHELGLIPRIPPVRAIPTKEYPTPATRPAYSVLDKSRYIRLTGKNPPLWQESLKQMLTALGRR